MMHMMPADSAPATALQASIDQAIHDNLHPSWGEAAMPWFSSSLLHMGVALISAFILFAATAPASKDSTERVVIPSVTEDLKIAALTQTDSLNVDKPKLPTQSHTEHNLTGGIDKNGKLNGAKGVLTSLGANGEFDPFPAIVRGGGAKGSPGGSVFDNGTDIGLIAPHGRDDGTILPPPAPGARKIVYLLDHSGSMLDSFDFLREEVKTRLNELRAFHQIGLIMFSEDTNMIVGPQLTRVTTDVKTQAKNAMDKVRAAGKNDDEFDVFAKGFSQAVAMNPDQIIFLTDGNFDARLVDHVATLTKGKKIRIDTIAFIRISADAEANLKTIATNANGRYRFVSDKDLR